MRRINTCQDTGRFDVFFCSGCESVGVVIAYDVDFPFADFEESYEI